MFQYNLIKFFKLQIFASWEDPKLSEDANHMLIW